MLPSRSVGIASALALVLAPVTAAAVPVCPDAPTVQAAHLVEFQTMMMGVAVRCRLVGVPILDHLDDMNGARRTMFAEANDRVATFLRSLKSKPLPTIAPLTGSASAASQPALAPVAKSAPGRSGAKKPGSGAAHPAPGPRKAPDRTASAPAAPPAKPVGARVSRRTDPYDRYLTMIGNQYGAGVTTLQRCKAFDAIVVAVSDRTNSDRLLTMVSSSLVQATLLEAIVNCPPGK